MTGLRPRVIDCAVSRFAIEELTHAHKQVIMFVTKDAPFIGDGLLGKLLSCFLERDVEMFRQALNIFV